VGTLTRAATSGSRAVAAVMGRHNAPQLTRWLRGGGQAHTRTPLRREVVTGGRLIGGNSTGVATRASRGRGLVWKGNRCNSELGA
jgi:hypothetical protein